MEGGEKEKSGKGGAGQVFLFFKLGLARPRSHLELLLMCGTITDRRYICNGSCRSYYT